MVKVDNKDTRTMSIIYFKHFAINRYLYATSVKRHGNIYSENVTSYDLIFTVSLRLKSDSHLSKKIVLFASMKAL